MITVNVNVDRIEKYHSLVVRLKPDAHALSPLPIASCLVFPIPPDITDLINPISISLPQYPFSFQLSKNVFRKGGPSSSLHEL